MSEKAKNIDNRLIELLSAILRRVVSVLFEGKVLAVWFCLPIFLAIMCNHAAYNWGDKDGYLPTQIQIIVRDLVYLLLYIIPFAIYQFFKNKSKWVMPKWYLLLPLAYLLRLWMAAQGHNFDLDSYNIVADLVLDKKIVYAHTERYNYGPLWFYILAICKYISLWFTNWQEVFHYLIVSVLFIAETYLATQLYKRTNNVWVALVFLFNPISIAVVGFHSQFDILAVAFAYAAYTLLEKKAIAWAIVALSLSLITKHIFIFFVFFVFFDSRLSNKHKLAFLILPILIFLMSFLPFYEAFDGIKKNVFEYNFGMNKGLFSPLLQLALPNQILEMGLFKVLPVFKGIMFFWLIIMIFFAYFVNKYFANYLFEFYLIIMVLTSTSFSEQYLLIPVFSLALFYKYYATWLYFSLGGFYFWFCSFNNVGNLQWFKTIFCVDMQAEQLKYPYTIILVCLLWLIIALYLKVKSKNLCQI